MEIIQTKTRKWGNSIGMILPKNILIKNKIRENQMLNFILLNDKGDVLEKNFGKLKDKLKISSQKMKNDSRKDEKDIIL